MKTEPGPDSKSLSWQVVVLVLAGVGLFYSGGMLLYLLLGNPVAGDYRDLARQRPYINAIFFTLLAILPFVIWSYVRDKRRKVHGAMPDLIAGMSIKVWAGLFILACGIGGSLISYRSAEPGGSYVVFIGLIMWGAVLAVSGFF